MNLNDGVDVSVLFLGSRIRMMNSSIVKYQTVSS